MNLSPPLQFSLSILRCEAAFVLAPLAVVAKVSYRSIWKPALALLDAAVSAIYLPLMPGPLQAALIVTKTASLAGTCFDGLFALYQEPLWMLRQQRASVAALSKAMEA